MLSDEQKQRLREAAIREGVDPEALIAAAAEDPNDDNEDKPSRDAPAKATDGEVKIFAYHLPFLTVAEIRKSIGLGPIADDGMPSGAWLAKHAGPAAPSEGIPPMSTDDAEA